MGSDCEDDGLPHSWKYFLGKYVCRFCNKNYEEED